MQQMHRHRTESSFYRRTQNASSFTHDYKRKIAKQAITCIILFVAALFIKTSSENYSEFVKDCIGYTVNQSTDLHGTFEKVKKFANAQNNKAETVSELDALVKMISPVDSEILSGFGVRTNSLNNEEEFHYGIDYKGKIGDKIKCASSGTVSEIGFSDEYGNYILVTHNDKIASFYAHCDRILPAKNDSVSSGQVIATIGDTGNVQEAMLHFEIREDDMSLDPMVFIK